ncbi:MAG: hypothetical protein CVU89_15670 [Firmicutes bacterium HGW-Firmicutes-14]|nr:MAG: hypothetical protein CVU89_15670 [Firmicutes bacterium HGW-Firmicutes-14]
MSKKTPGLLILDANILIDFFKCERTVIKLINKHVGQVFLATPIFDEVKQIKERDCIRLGIKLIEPDLDQLAQASGNIGSLSFQDNLCLILAKEHAMTCVTNDKPLRRQCASKKVPTIWGIELICMLVESGGLSAEDGKTITQTIQANNPKYITQAIVQKALMRIGAVSD